MSAGSEAHVSALADEILRYLRAHRSASDTAEGIAQWWVKRQQLEDTLDRVEAALDRLVADALVERRITATGHVLYELSTGGDGTRPAEDGT